MFPRNGITGKCDRLGPQEQHFLRQAIVLSIPCILQDITRRSQHVYLLRPFHLVDGARKRPQMLSLFLFAPLASRIGSLILFQGIDGSSIDRIFCLYGM
jgi:hypothetical protein